MSQHEARLNELGRQIAQHVSPGTSVSISLSTLQAYFLYATTIQMEGDPLLKLTSQLSGMDRVRQALVHAIATGSSDREAVLKLFEEFSQVSKALMREKFAAAAAALSAAAKDS